MNKRISQAGYGLVMLMMFLSSTVLLGASMQMMVGPGTVAYLGSTSQDDLSAKELAMAGMETVLADIQTKLSSNTTVDTSYTYSSANMSMPNDPASLGGATSVVGSFSATMTAARGNAYLVKVTAVVGSATETLSRLVPMNRTGSLVDSMTAPNAAFGLRKLRSAYAGSAIRVRRSSDNTEQDIGFDGAGNLDMDSLRTFLGTSTPPVDTVGSAAVAYSLRRVRSAYTGAYAIRVRRSSDSTEQDIGFTPAGDLDVAALLNFVGTGTGYVKTWYDQSGNASNATQTTTSLQPTIVVSGVVNLMNNQPTITFDGVDDTLPMSVAVYDDMTIMACYNVVTGVGSPGSASPAEARIINSDVGGVANDFTVGVDTSGNVNGYVGNPDASNGSYAPSPGAPGDGKLHWMAFTRTKATGYYNVYNENASYGDGNGNTASLNASPNIWLNWHVSGSMSEVLMYSSVLTEANRLIVERNEGWYFNIAPIFASFTGPLDSVGGATVAYGLRKLRSAYGGYAIKVRRSSDNATQDIGFDGASNLDVGALMTFVGNSSGYINTWYDQSTNVRNATQATVGFQPRIVNAGVLETQNGNPTVRFISASGTAMSFTELSGITDYSAFAVVKLVNPAADNYLLTGSSQNRQLLRLAGPIIAFFGGSTTPATTNTVPTTALGVFALIRTGGTGVGYANGASYATTGSDAGSMYFGTIGALGGSCSDSYISEIIFYSSALSTANRQSIEQSQLAYFSPNSPDAYISKWYDQSGHGYDATQTNPLLQPSLILPRYGISNNRPTIHFNGSQYLSTTGGMPTSADYSKVGVFSYFDATKANNIISGSGPIHALYMGASNYLNVWHAFHQYASTLPMVVNTNYAFCATFLESGLSATPYRSNTSGGTSGSLTSANTDATIQLGALNNGNSLYGTMSEAMVFARVLSTVDRTAIYNDERAYYAAQ